ncbi:SDR family oxidoreductase [uncultured Williamsia sp.]|uniref:SDR family oxidoreductase n=1 Tax=uncultured Williamsia sp. TaxID=259311 RepID=UPI002619FD31|nr:SDR family oxidoreductase [uncultured Williamsia sp.]
MTAVAPGDLAGHTIVMSGGSRGIGLAILLAAAKRGANAVILAKTDAPDPRLPGTVHTAVAEIEAAGGRATAVVGDVRNEDDVARAVQTALDTYGGVDVCVNNASAISQTATTELSAKRYDLMADINVRGTFLLSKACLPHLVDSGRGQILTLSPPLNMSPHWLGRFPAYTMTKYAMTTLTLGFSAEVESVAATCLWPQTRIATAVIKNLLGGDEAVAKSRDPAIMADAAAVILTSGGSFDGQTVIDADVLRGAGVTDLSGYGGGDDPTLDLYVDP